MNLMIVEYRRLVQKMLLVRMLMYYFIGKNELEMIYN